MINTDRLHRCYLESSGASIDTRTILPDQMFFALRGDQSDGHNYVDKALDAGAQYCVVDRPEWREHPKCLYVNNVLASMHRLAHHHRCLFQIPTLAITGSNGKTSTKEMISAVLDQKFETTVTQGNYNNHLGVPLTLLQLRSSSEVAIVEMGANHQGEIQWLCHLAKPTHGLVTNIGKAHLEGFGDINTIRKTKFELYYFLASHSGTLLYNGDETTLSEVPRVFPQAEPYRHDHLPGSEVAKIAFREDGHFIAVDLIPTDKAKDLIRFRTAFYGRHNQYNLLTAIAIGLYFGVDPKDIAAGLEAYQPKSNRSQIIEDGNVTYYLDAYNANPTSMSRALSFMSTLISQEKMLILGDMMELGAVSEQEHVSIIEQSLKLKNVRKILLVGRNFERAFDRLGRPLPCLSFGDVKEVTRYLDGQSLEGLHILIKGSRAMKLETLIHA